MDFINEKIKKFFEEDSVESDGKKPSQEEKQNVRDYFESGFDYRLNKCFDACKEARLIQSKISNNIEFVLIISKILCYFYLSDCVVS